HCSRLPIPGHASQARELRLLRCAPRRSPNVFAQDGPSARIRQKLCRGDAFFEPALACFILVVRYGKWTSCNLFIATYSASKDLLFGETLTYVETNRNVLAPSQLDS